jgi:hypothetical protein
MAKEQLSLLGETPKAQPTHKQRKLLGLCRCGNVPRSGYNQCESCAEKARQVANQRTAQRQASGACTVCGKPPERGRLCDGCRTRLSERSESQRKARRQAGLCVRCGDPAVGNGSHCQVHLEAERERTASRRAALIAAGLRRPKRGVCLKCGAQASKGALCDLHRKDQKSRERTREQEARLRLRRAGLCIYNGCGKPLDRKGVYCGGCTKRVATATKQIRAIRREQGLCERCPNPANATNTLCLRHWFGHIAGHNMKSRNRAADVQVIWERQDGRCAYSGIQLVAGTDSNVNLDHVIPKARGGPDAPENLEFVAATVNQMKRDLTRKEFEAAILFLASRINRPLDEATTATALAVLSRPSAVVQSSRAASQRKRRPNSPTSTQSYPSESD